MENRTMLITVKAQFILNRQRALRCAGAPARPLPAAGQPVASAPAGRPATGAAWRACRREFG